MQFKIDLGSKQCDSGYVAPWPEYMSGVPPENWVDVYKWQSCGKTCCKRVFEICKTFDATAMRTIFKVREIEKVKLLPCENEGNYEDWKTGNPIPCNEDC